MKIKEFNYAKEAKKNRIIGKICIALLPGSGVGTSFINKSRRLELADAKYHPERYEGIYAEYPDPASVSGAEVIDMTDVTPEETTQTGES